MRLIDADALMKKFCVNSEGRRIPEVDCDNHEITVSIKDIKRIIREQPTAYDVEKVVAEVTKTGDIYCDVVNCKYCCTDCDHYVLMKSIIANIRKGGVE